MMIVKIMDDGSSLLIYDDSLQDLMETLGEATTRRASDVEPEADGTWSADMSKSGFPVKLTGFRTRQEALDAERNFIEENILR